MPRTSAPKARPARQTVRVWTSLGDIAQPVLGEAGRGLGEAGRAVSGRELGEGGIAQAHGTGSLPREAMKSRAAIVRTRSDRVLPPLVTPQNRAAPHGFATPPAEARDDTSRAPMLLTP